MSNWLKNLIGISFIFHGLNYGLMVLIPFPDSDGRGMEWARGKYWSGTGSKILSSFNVSEYRIRLIAIIICLILLAGFIIAGSIILTTGALNIFPFTLTLISAILSVIFLISYWHIYSIGGFLINIAILIIIPILYIKLQNR